MVLIDEINGVKFYDGMDYDYALNYNKEELIVFFIKDIESVLDNKKKSKKRNDVIDSLLGNIDKEDIKDISVENIMNDYIYIYLTNGYLDEVSDIVISKFKLREKYKPIFGQF